jgi:endonuclease YncB( thermonuclease family)
MTPADFDAHLYHYAATCLRVVDGDTFVALVDCGFGVRRQLTVRITGYDAPELHGATAAAGQEARTALLGLISTAPLRLRTRKDSLSFERYLARVYIQQGAVLEDVADLMIAAGHGVPM